MKWETGVLYRVFDYGDELQVNEIHGRAIIRQLVCSGYCYSILMPRGPIDPSHRERGNRFQTTAELRKHAYPSSLLCRTTGWCCTKKPTLECHESRSELYSPDRSNLSGVYPRNKSMASKKEKGRATRREEEREREKRRERKKRERKRRNRFIASLVGLL